MHFHHKSSRTDPEKSYVEFWKYWVYIQIKGYGVTITLTDVIVYGLAVVALVYIVKLIIVLC